MPKVGLQRSGIDPVIGELEAAGVAQHVGVRLDTQLGGDGGPFDHAIKPWGRQGCPALRYEHKGRRRAVAPMPPELAQFPACQGMRRRRAALEPVDVNLAPVEVDLLPFQIGHLRCAQAMPVGHEHHEGISTAMSVAPCRLDQPLDLLGPQMLPLAQVFVFRPDRRLVLLLSHF